MEILTGSNENQTFTLLIEGLFLCFTHIDYDDNDKHGVVLLFREKRYLGMIDSSGRQAFLEAYFKAKEQIQGAVTSDLRFNDRFSSTLRGELS